MARPAPLSEEWAPGGQPSGFRSTPIPSIRIGPLLYQTPFHKEPPHYGPGLVSGAETSDPAPEGSIPSRSILSSPHPWQDG